MMSYSEILPQLFDTLKPFTKQGFRLKEQTELVAELGLDSLQVMQVLLKIEDHFDISILLNNSLTSEQLRTWAKRLEKLLKG
ncbi:MAG: acyl carrier protein [Nitrospirales bacterium]|nr:acyl carrier protein [Nitrospirales bacterium]